MKKGFLIISLIGFLGANPTFMGGITFKFGSDLSGVGATIKVISNEKKKKAVIAAGATYYPWEKDKNKQLGLDVSAGYNVNEHTTIMGGWDFLQNQPSVSLGIHPDSSNSKKGEAIDTDSIKHCSQANK